MASGYGYDDDYDEDEGTGPRALRDALKERDKALKALQKQFEDQQAQLKKYEASQRKQSVAELLTAKGLNPKVSALIPADVEPTEAGVGAWLEEFGDVFGVTPPANDSSQSHEDSAAAATLHEESDPEVAALRAAWEQNAAAADGTAPASLSALAANDLAKIGETATSFEDVAKALAGLPGFKVSDYAS